MVTASFFGIAGKCRIEVASFFRNGKKDIVDSRLEMSYDVPNVLLLKNYKKLPSNENGSKSRMDFVLMISPFGDVK